jgi:hypothetical protein
VGGGVTIRTDVQEAFPIIFIDGVPALLLQFLVVEVWVQVAPKKHSRR